MLNSEFILKGTEKVQVYPTKVSEKPLVSICVQTYKHENYIKQCLDGLLMQKTAFKFEILLGEDDSPDRTREICIEYAKKYPDKIRLFLHDRSNVIYINGNATGRYNFIYNLTNSNGVYIALCEGDDYWTDPNKLQKQVDFLEKNKDFGLVHTDCDFLYDNNGVIKKDINKVNNNIIPSGNIYNQLLERNRIKTLTAMFRSEFINPISSPEFLNFKMGDYPMWLEISRITKIGYIENSTAVYRIRSNSASNFLDIKSHYRFQLEVYKIKFYFIKKYGCTKETEEEIYKNYYKLMLNYSYVIKDRKEVKQYFKKLKHLKLNTYDTKLKYIGSLSTVSNYLANFFIKIRNKISSLLK